MPLDGSATTSPEWDRLPRHTFAAPGGGDTTFQLRWAADHLTAFVTVDDAEAAPGDAVTLVSVPRSPAPSTRSAATGP